MLLPRKRLLWRPPRFTAAARGERRGRHDSRLEAAHARRRLLHVQRTPAHRGRHGESFGSGQKLARRLAAPGGKKNNDTPRSKKIYCCSVQVQVLPHLSMIWFFFGGGVGKKGVPSSLSSSIMHKHWPNQLHSR